MGKTKNKKEAISGMKTTYLNLLKKFFNNVGKFRREISEIRK